MREVKPQYRTLREAIISANLQTGATLASEWVYHDEDGVEVFRILDYTSEDDGRRHVRTVWPVSPGEEGWCMGDPPAPWPLYRLPDLEPFQRVYICQDETDAEAARSAGLIATTAAHGCYYLGKTDFSPLAGRDVVVVPKFDAAGPVFVRRLTAILARLRPPAEVRVMELPGLPECGGSLSEYLPMCHPRTPEVVGAEIDELADRLPEYWTLRRSRSLTTRLLDVPATGVQWLWPGRIVMGKLNLLFGYNPPGKSPLGIDLAARVSRGLPWPDGSGTAPRGSVLLLNYEDSLAETIRPQLEQAGADLNQVLALREPERNTAGRAELTSIAALRFSIDQANLRVREAVPGAGLAGAVKLLLIDPVSWYLSGNANAALGALARLAADRDIAVVMILPAYKPSGALRKFQAMGGPALAAAQSAWLTVPDSAMGDRRLMLPLKGFDADATGLAFRIVDGRVEWESEPVHLRAEDVLLAPQRRKKPGPPPVIRAAAADWLRQRLSFGPAYVGSPDLEEPGSLRHEAREAGFSWATIRRAYAAIGAVSERCPLTGKYRWKKPSREDAKT